MSLTVVRYAIVAEHNEKALQLKVEFDVSPSNSVFKVYEREIKTGMALTEYLRSLDTIPYKEAFTAHGISPLRVKVENLAEEWRERKKMEEKKLQEIDSQLSAMGFKPSKQD